MKNYEQPIIEIIVINEKDIITESPTANETWPNDWE